MFMSIARFLPKPDYLGVRYSCLCESRTTCGAWRLYALRITDHAPGVSCMSSLHGDVKVCDERGHPYWSDENA